MAVSAQSDWQEPAAGDYVAEVPPRPTASPITIERFPDGISIRVPPAGLWRGSKGLFVFSLLWNGFMAIVSAMMVGIALGANNMPDETATWVLPLFLAVFWLVGIGLLLSALNMGRREAAIAVAGGTLMVMQIGIFGKKQREWALADVVSIGMGPTGMEVNDVPVMELQIRDQGGKKFGLLAGRSNAELQWLASELQQARVARDNMQAPS